ncbi:hypothetical protein [Acinetobacter pseudolwoffii]|uniref:hypothetical protein n=1 Tax=Acinetobacter pseudolwoffii TaxID=2053287 RepID=UPI0024683270|nr:hypothetical protein [Acinetobacter pseudolwoffii]MDH5819535.1 hypothetical protein [Acinetobacter pseudolwoffii]
MNQFLSIEVVRAEVQLLELAHELVMLSTADDVVEVNDNRITLTYVGRGSESIMLCLDEKYSDSARIRYARENMARLEKIKSDLVSWAA